MKALYRVVFPNGKAYIGVAADPAVRWQAHQANARRGMDLPVYRALRKYPEARIEVLVWGPDDYIFALEERAIAAFQTMSRTHGYNAAKGGNRSPVEGVGHSAETRARMSEAQKSRVRTPEELGRMKDLAAKSAALRSSSAYRAKARQSALRRWARKRSAH